MYIYSFEKLEVWVEAKDFTKEIYKLTSKFPDSERFGLTGQLRRASVSICSNIAEGTTRSSFRDQAHFSTISFGSAVEVLNQLILSFELGYISESEYRAARDLLENITKKINALKSYQIKQINK
jgi:four helix bundle protein